MCQAFFTLFVGLAPRWVKNRCNDDDDNDDADEWSGCSINQPKKQLLVFRGKGIQNKSIFKSDELSRAEIPSVVGACTRHHNLTLDFGFIVLYYYSVWQLQLQIKQIKIKQILWHLFELDMKQLVLWWQRLACLIICEICDFSDTWVCGRCWCCVCWKACRSWLSCKMITLIKLTEFTHVAFSWL